MVINKKGYLRTLEAVIAIVLIVTFIFYLTPKSRLAEPGVPENVKNSQKYILERISSDSDLRSCIVGADCNGVSNVCSITSDCKNNKLDPLVIKNTPIGYDNDFIVCKGTTGCVSTQTSSVEGDVYVNDIFIASSGLGNVNPNFLRLFMWEKG